MSAADSYARWLQGAQQRAEERLRARELEQRLVIARAARERLRLRRLAARRSAEKV